MKCRRKSKTFISGCHLSQLLIWAVLAWLVFCPTAVAEAPVKDQRKVLVIYSSREDAPYTALIESAVRNTLSAGLADRLDYYAEYVDLARFSAPEYQDELQGFLSRKYAGRRLDVVIAEGNAPLGFVARHGAMSFSALARKPNGVPAA